MSASDRSATLAAAPLGVTDNGSGMIVYRASRLEALLEPLAALMQAVPPERVLAPHEVIVAHPGMLKWLSRALALRRGPGGIVANLRIELPSEWLERLAVQVLGEEAIAVRPYRREVLRWRVHECLATLDDARVAAYLAAADGDGASAAQRRFQLAERLARIYTRYLVYRPDWLRDWAAGRRPVAPDSFLAALWQRLRERIGQPHRGETLARLAAALARANPPAADEPLHVFGFAHLAPSELDVLRALARHRPVVLYIPDPCREYWGGLRTPRAQLRELVRAGAAAAEDAFLAQPHPLLASWGRMGQHFMIALEDGASAIDERHWQDLSDAPRLDTRLQRVQESIRQLRPELIGEAGAGAGARADASLRVHACHTRLRELEVLRDALLRARSDDPELLPSDIAVLMPDVQAYLPLLPTVFGPAGRHEGALPYHCFDVAVARVHPLFAAFRQLLGVPQSRVTAPEVIDLLAVPEVARRLGVGAGDIDVLTGWLRRGRVAWALDAAFRERFDVPAIADHTFAWALERLLAGYVIGTTDATADAIELADASRIAPLEGIEGPQAALVGALDTLLVELAAWCDAASAPRRASEWAALLEQRIEALFRIDITDHDAREARALLLRFVRALASEPEESGLDPLLDFAVVREVLLQRLDAVPERQRFLLGGVTFCGMVPQRAIPFRLIAVLGLDDGEFPRAGGDGGLDLMAAHPRLGDRDVRSDDRYLFLETLMSARQQLHLSYIGEGVRDAKPRNPAAPLAELMAALDAAARAGSQDADAAPARPWLVRHPLQPFDARYFDGTDPALFSFRAGFAAMRRAGVEAPPFVATAAPQPARADAGAATPMPVALTEVLAYYRNPARQLLAHGLNLRLRALDDDGLRASEPLDGRFEAIDRVSRRLFFDAVATPEPVLPPAPPDWIGLSGLLPPGRLGAAAWQRERDTAQQLLAAIADHAAFAGGLAPGHPLAVDGVVADRYAVRGELRRVHRRGDTFWVVDVFPSMREEEDLSFKARIGLFLEWALLRLDAASDGAAVRVCAVLAGQRAAQFERAFDKWDAAFVAAGAGARRTAMRRELEQRIGGVLAFWAHSQRQPQWYFPLVSWAALDGDAAAVRARWIGQRGMTGERDYAPGYARLLAGEREFGDGADFAALCANATALHALTDLGQPLAPTP